MLFVVFPRPVVNLTVVVLVLAFAVCLVIPPLALVNIAVCMNQPANAI